MTSAALVPFAVSDGTSLDLLRLKRPSSQVAVKGAILYLNKRRWSILHELNPPLSIKTIVLNFSPMSENETKVMTLRLK